jgi:hypothetical protein
LRLFCWENKRLWDRKLILEAIMKTRSDKVEEKMEQEEAQEGDLELVDYDSDQDD